MTFFFRHILLAVEIIKFGPKSRHLPKVFIFFLSFEEIGDKRAPATPKRVQRCCYKWKGETCLLPSLQTRQCWCWRLFALRRAKILQRRWTGGITRWGSVPNANENALLWKVTCNSVSKRLLALETIQHQRISVAYEWKPRAVERRLFACEHLLQPLKKRMVSLITS